MKPLLILFLSLALTSPAFSLSGAIGGPQLAFPENASKETINQVLTFLNKEVTFLDGRFFSESTYQNYAAPTGKISELITLLHSKGFTIKVAFLSDKESKASFTISNAGGPQGTLTLSVNLAAPDFDPRKLHLAIP